MATTPAEATTTGETEKVPEVSPIFSFLLAVFRPRYRASLVIVALAVTIAAMALGGAVWVVKASQNFDARIESVAVAVTESHLEAIKPRLDSIEKTNDQQDDHLKQIDRQTLSDAETRGQILGQLRQITEQVAGLREDERQWHKIVK